MYFLENSPPLNLCSILRNFKTFSQVSPQLIPSRTPWGSKFQKQGKTSQPSSSLPLWSSTWVCDTLLFQPPLFIACCCIFISFSLSATNLVTSSIYLLVHAFLIFVLMKFTPNTQFFILIVTDFISKSSSWFSLKSARNFCLIINISIGKDMEKSETLCNVSRHVKWWCGYYEK